jgi:hypothetical protein
VWKDTSSPSLSLSLSLCFTLHRGIGSLSLSPHSCALVGSTTLQRDGAFSFHIFVTETYNDLHACVHWVKSSRALIFVSRSIYKKLAICIVIAKVMQFALQLLREHFIWPAIRSYFSIVKYFIAIPTKLVLKIYNLTICIIIIIIIIATQRRGKRVSPTRAELQQ